jgi:hypothetical protein
MVPASVLRYGSILMEVTRRPLCLRRRPMEEMVMPRRKGGREGGKEGGRNVRDTRG